MNIIFMGSPEFAIPALKALDSYGHKLLAVYTQPPKPAGRGKNLVKTPVHVLAENYGVQVLHPISLKSPDIQKQFKEFNADVAVVAAYGLLLPKEILEAPKFGCINIHPSRLPRWRGAAPIQRTIMAGDKKTGMAIMQMGTGLDSGDILSLKHFDIRDEMTAGELHDEMANIGAEELIKVLENIQNIKPLKQSEEGITYANKILKSDEEIDWNKPALVIYNQIRGLCPRPGAFTLLHGERIKIFKSRVISGNNNYLAGEVQSEELEIKCGTDAIKILELQLAGGKILSSEEFLKGRKISRQTRLGQ